MAKAKKKSKHQKLMNDPTDGRNSPAEIAFDMEGDLLALLDFGHILTIIATSLSSAEEMNAVARIGYEIIEYGNRVEQNRQRVVNGLRK